MLAARSGCHSRQSDDGSIAQRSDGFQAHVAGALDGPFIVLFQQQGADQAGDGGFVGEDADDLAASLISPLSRSSGLVLCSLVRCWAGKPL